MRQRNGSGLVLSDEVRTWHSKILTEVTRAFLFPWGGPALLEGNHWVTQTPGHSFHPFDSCLSIHVTASLKSLKYFSSNHVYILHIYFFSLRLLIMHLTCLVFSDRLTWTFLAGTARRLVLRHKSLTSDTVRLSPVPVVTSDTLINARLKKRRKERGREENETWKARRNETKRDGDTILPPPPDSTEKANEAYARNWMQSCQGTQRPPKVSLICSAPRRGGTRKKIRRWWWRMGGCVWWWWWGKRGGGGGGWKKDEQTSGGGREGWFSSRPFFAHAQLKQRTCKRVSDRFFSWMCWIWNDGPQCKEYKEGFCLLYRKKPALRCFNIKTHLRLYFHNNLPSIILSYIEINGRVFLS